MTTKTESPFTGEHIKDTLSSYMRYWYLFIIGIITCILFAFVYLQFLSTPVYEVSGAILIKDSKKPSGSNSASGALEDLNMFKEPPSVENKVQEIKSKTYLQRVVKDLKLETTYYLDGPLKQSELYGNGKPFEVAIEKLDPEAYLLDEINIKVVDKDSFEFKDDFSTKTYKFGQRIRKSYGAFTVNAAPEVTEYVNQPIIIKFNNVSMLVQTYALALNVASISEFTDVLTVSIQTPVPEKGKDILNKLIEVANEEELSDKNKMAINTIKFIDERLKYLTSDLSGVEKNVENLKQQNNLTDVSSNAQAYIQQSGQNDQQLNIAEVQINVINSIQSYLQGNQYQLVPSSLGIQDATLASLITRFNELQLERQRLLKTVQESNPIVINNSEQLADLKNNILENLANIKKGLTISRNNLRSNSSQFQSKIQTVPSVERELQQIQRQQGVKEQLYSYLLQEREKAALSLAATVSNARTIDQVNVNPIPVSPKKQLIYLCAFLLGIGIPIAGIYTKDLLNNKIQDIKDIEFLTNIPVLGELTHNELKGQQLVVGHGSRTTISELFRLIRTNLHYLTSQKDNKVILVTSTVSGEGKTFFTSNLGATLALTDKKVLLVEFDLRNPVLLSNFNARHEVGITDYITNKNITLDDIIKPSGTSPNLFLLAAGPMKENPAELMLSSRVGELIRELRQEFDFILIDSSPVGQVADTFSLVPYIDSSIYVIRYNYTSKSQINILNDIASKLKDPMIVMNDAKGGNFNGYGYGYGYHSADNKKVKLIG